MRGMKAWFAALVILPALGCKKSPEKKHQELLSCGAITLDAAGLAQCLELQYTWKHAEAVATAQGFQHERDSTAKFRADSVWRTDAENHRREIERCSSDPSGSMARCLQDSFGWLEARAKAADDSAWAHNAAKHRDEVRTCTRRRGMGAGACLQLYYKWSPERALAVDDSIRRAKLR